MTLDEALKKLEALGSEKMRAQNAKRGAGDNQYGVRMGDIRKVAKTIKTDLDLAMALWKTGNIDARLLAILIVKPKDLSVETMDEMVRGITFFQVADWFNGYLSKKHPQKETLRQQWLTADDPMALRAGWSLTAKRIATDADGLDLAALLDRIEAEMASAHPNVQWTMNMSLGEIGINFEEHRERVLAIGEKLGIYRDFPVSKGCTSPFVPYWVNEMVRRQNA